MNHWFDAVFIAGVLFLFWLVPAVIYKISVYAFDIDEIETSDTPGQDLIETIGLSDVLTVLIGGQIGFGISYVLLTWQYPAYSGDGIPGGALGFVVMIVFGVCSMFLVDRGRRAI